MKFTGLLFIFILTACASSGGDSSGSERTMWPDSEEQSSASAEAWGNEMFVRKDMPNRADPKGFDFYYKHCAMNGNEAYYSKTSYDCTGR